MERDDLGRRVRAELDLTRARITALEAGFEDVVRSAEDVATDDEHDPEGHTIAFERQQLASLLDESRTQAGELAAAIARLESGTYGSCEVCGRPIGDARLEALPATRRCIACAP
ncbi:MAG: TraR/DksA C4-type zinc finger protein [Acidimicrobiia bacterium]|nr:TraR/DksA C4-type zinc finger protein [Acidimicrobiia bacterium]